MTIADLVSHVFGPYPEHILLKSSFPPPRSGIKVPLDEVELYFEDKPIGFDDSEFIINPPALSPLANNRNGVTFFGILEIQDLDWLSEKGLQYLERDFEEYDQKIHLSHMKSRLSIQRLYGQSKGEGSSRLKVRVGCVKNLLAHYLTADKDPEKLLIFSKCEDINRTYWVQSLHVSTFEQSRNFLERFRLRALIVELIETDPDETNLEDRNIDWLIRRYFAEIRPRDRDRRIIAEPQLDSRIESEPRHLRHIPRAEIRGWFAKHADWLLANQIASNGPNTKLVDIPQWITFCKQARYDSIEAKLNGVQWGPSDQLGDSPISYDLPKNLARYGQTVAFWSQQLKNASQRTERRTDKRAPKQRKPPSPERGPSPDVISNPLIFQYDSDFSEPTTSESSDSDSAPISSHIPKLPHILHEPPSIQNGHFTWHCQLCDHIIDLLNVSSLYLDLLTPQVTHVLNAKSWKVNDDPIQEALCLMVSHHYTTKHLHPKGLRLSKKATGKFYLEDINSVAQINGQMKKEEEPVEPILRRSVRNPKPLRRGS